MVSGAGPITRVGGRLEAEGRAYFTEEVVAEIAGTIIDRLNLKARKFANCDPSTWLLVYIDDARLPMECGEIPLCRYLSRWKHRTGNLRAYRRYSEVGLLDHAKRPVRPREVHPRSLAAVSNGAPMAAAVRSLSAATAAGAPGARWQITR
jgi:hypothetical protein